MPVQPTVSPARSASGNCSALSQARLFSAVATLRDALAPDVALDVPAVLDRSALLDVLSVLFTSTTTPTAAVCAPVSCLDPLNPGCQCPACQLVDADPRTYIVCGAGDRSVVTA